MAPRGPKGWVRDDERILDEICERLAREGVDASEVHIRVQGGEVRIEGALATRAERRAMVDVAERTLGVVRVDADVLVREDAGAPPADHAKEPTWH